MGLPCFLLMLFGINSFRSLLTVFFSIPLRMTETIVTNGTNRLEVLVKRLNEAERRSKLLKCEVKSIRKEISSLKDLLGTHVGIDALLASSATAATPSRALSNTVIVVDDSPSTSAVDGFTSYKRPTEESGPTNSKRSRSDFNKENDYVVVYTDGACENNGKPNAKAGIGVWFGDDHPLNVSKPVEGRATNNTAEIQACVQALKVIRNQGESRVKLMTDSEFTINCMTKWIRNWKKNNWKTASGGPVKNKEDLQVLDEIMNTFADVKWIHVAGHNGIKGNEEADKLAREGALRYKKS